MSNHEKELREKIMQLVLDAIRKDQSLREQYQIGDKFRFVRDRLEELRVRVEAELQVIQDKFEKKSSVMSEDETVVYIHLFNAHGLSLPTWQKMLTPSVFYDHSINRPVYLEKAHIEAFIRSRQTQAHHAYLAMVIRKSEILPNPDDAPEPKDQIGHPLVKIREGSLTIAKMKAFVHQEHEYTVNEAGHLIKKQDV